LVAKARTFFVYSFLGLFAAPLNANEIYYRDQDWAWSVLSNRLVIASDNPDGTELQVNCNLYGTHCVIAIHLYGTCDRRLANQASNSVFYVGDREFRKPMYCLGDSYFDSVRNASKVVLTTNQQSRIDSLIQAFSESDQVTIRVQYNNGKWTELVFSLRGFLNVSSNAYQALQEAQRAGKNTGSRGQKDL